MKITVKNIQQETFSITIDENKTVLDLKELIYKLKKGEYVVEKQQLIYGGVVLEDDKTIGSYEIDESKTVVILLKKNLQTAEDREKEDVKELPPVSTTANSATMPSRKIESDDSTGNTVSKSVSENVSGTTIEHPSLEIIGQGQNEDIIRLIIDMGFNRETVEEALALNYDNPLRAVEYLLLSSQNIENDDINTNDSSLDGSLLDDSILDDATILNELSQDDRDAIERLVSLGFPLLEVIQVYFACGKNEELAASILSSPDEDDQ